MNKNKLLYLGMILLISLSFMVLAEVTTLSYDSESSDDSGKSYAYSFLDNSFVEVESDGDIYFVGSEDKEEGAERPSLYIDSELGKIEVKTESKCSNLEYLSQEAEIEEGQEYCLISKDGSKYVNVRVIELDPDWKSVNIEWEILSDVNKEPFKFDSRLLMYLGIILGNLLLLFLIILVFMKIRKVPKRKHVQFSEDNHCEEHCEEYCKTHSCGREETHRFKHKHVRGYCLKCGKKVELLDAHKITLKNGAIAYRGRCPDCKEVVVVIVGKDFDKRVKGYCVKCKRKVVIHDPIKTVLENGARAIQGSCLKCKNMVTKITGKGVDKRIKAYCLKCNRKVAVDKIKIKILKNGAEAVAGQCPKCQTKVFSIVGRIDDYKKKRKWSKIKTIIISDESGEEFPRVEIVGGVKKYKIVKKSNTQSKENVPKLMKTKWVNKGRKVESVKVCMIDPIKKKTLPNRSKKTIKIQPKISQKIKKILNLKISWWAK